MKRFFRPSQGQIPDGLPVGGETLSSDIRQLHKSCPLLEEAEGRSGLNRLELFRIPHQNNLRPGTLRPGGSSGTPVRKMALGLLLVAAMVGTAQEAGASTAIFPEFGALICGLVVLNLAAWK